MKLYRELIKARLEQITGGITGLLKGLIYYRTDDDRPYIDTGAAANFGAKEIMVRETLAGDSGPYGTPDPIKLTEGGTNIVDYSSYDEGDVLTLNANRDGFLVEAASGGGGLDSYLNETFKKTNAVDFTSGQGLTFLTASTAFDGVLSDGGLTMNGLGSILYTANVVGATSLNDWFASPVIDLFLKQRDTDNGITFFIRSELEAEIVVWDVTNGAKLNSVLDVVTDTSGNELRYSATFYPPATCTQVQYGAHILTAPTTLAELEFTDVELSTNPFVYKDTLETQDIFFDGMTGHGSSWTNNLHSTVTPSQNGNGIFTYVNSASTGLMITFLKKCTVVANIGSVATSSGLVTYGIYKNQTTSSLGSGEPLSGQQQSHQTATLPTSTAGTSIMEAGDNITIYGQAGAAFFFSSIDFRISAIAATEHVVTPATASQEVIQYTGYLARNGATVRLATEAVNTGSILVEVDNTSETRYIFKKKCNFSSTSNLVRSATNYGASNIVLYSSVGALKIATYIQSTGSWVSSGNALSGQAEAGDYLLLSTDTAGAYDNNVYNNFVVTATPLEATFLAAVPVQKVANIQHRNAGTSQALTTSFATLSFNTVASSGGFESLSSSQITIQAGVYLIDASVQFEQLASAFGAIYTKIVNITDSIDYHGINSFVNTTNYSTSRLYEKLVLTKTTIVEIQGRKSGGGTANYGSLTGAPGDLAGFITITKLR